jgi:hypothetical protein
MVAFLDMFVGQFVHPFTLITLIVGAVWCRPPQICGALILGAAGKAMLTAIVFPYAISLRPFLLVAAAFAGALGITIGAGLRRLINRARSPADSG